MDTELEKPGVRERNKQRTREALEEAAVELFAEKGFEATTVDEQAGVARRTYFRYFPTKEAVMFPYRQRWFARFGELLADRPEGETAFEAVRRAHLEVAKGYMATRDDIVARQRIVVASPNLVAAELEHDALWEQAIAEALMMGRRGVRLERQANIAAGAIFGVVRAVLREWFAGDGKGDLGKRGAEAFDLLAAGELLEPFSGCS